jgi:hypothetical protein
VRITARGIVSCLSYLTTRWENISSSEDVVVADHLQIIVSDTLLAKIDEEIVDQRNTLKFPDIMLLQMQQQRSRAVKQRIRGKKEGKKRRETEVKRG